MDERSARRNQETGCQNGLRGLSASQPRMRADTHDGPEQHWALYGLLIVQPFVGWTATSAYRAPIATGGFYFQASDGSVTLPVAGYNYNSVWTPLLAGLPPAGMAASLAALARPCGTRSTNVRAASMYQASEVEQFRSLGQIGGSSNNPNTTWRAQRTVGSAGCRRAEATAGASNDS
jgi:hypothetical protein